ncbi:FAD-dependent oxidoreductase [Bradyrhizobium sp. CCBAU 53340]|uniref:flavin-containing monooxygenase n=1 Tax=Bradyrhizobium sp. CCBAU 53340 TaxID=1325112 RepID=UPI00188AE2F5|nr:NAD(P)/FAD-dependent oxidoreductase [Bradyrhizobium sp. CCBAU 53340]QOZ47206.1 FAD-dependent oxidoreductase [Bradyrhizobium sp. CCBAU 53340]
MPEAIETIVIGGGQAGLAMSYHLTQRGRSHVVLERGRVAERWQSERWDSLAFQFPNAMLRLPGHAYSGNAPDGFMGRDGVARFIADYAMKIAAPLRCGVVVSSVRPTNRGRFVVQAGQHMMEAANLVIATGPYQLPSVPPCSASFPPAVHQVTANRYTRPSDLPPGAVLVVGSGGSGCQIVEDLRGAAREVFYATRRHRRWPRRYRGHDVGWWIEESGMTNMTGDRMPPEWRNFKAPLITGVGGGHTIDLRQIASEGVTLLGSLLDLVDGRLHLANDLNANLKAGDDTFVQFVRTIDEFIETKGLEAPVEEGFDPYLRAVPEVLPEVDRLDLHDAKVTTVIWATGYRYDFEWINCPVFDKQGAPIQQRGVTAIPGLYFLGLPRMHKVKSAFLWGVGEDAEYLASEIAARATNRSAGR